jgi:RNA polymerase sigma-70 factor (ECF subfamily)
VSGKPEVDRMRDERIAAPADAAQAAAFRRLAERHLESGYRLACAILGNPSEAQDATHDAFLQAWRKWSTLRDPESFEPWFDRIVANTCRNQLRRSGRWRTRDLSEGDAIVTADPMGQALDREVLRAALATLSPDHRIVVALRFYRDLTAEQIAERLGIPAGTVRSRLHYATQRLHDALDDAEPHGADR